MYQKLAAVFERFLPRSTLFKYGFNLSPMYRRSTGRIRRVSPDLHRVEIEIPLSWRNVNYVGTMFGGSMLSATDPIYMVQLVNILGRDFIVWDKAVQFRFRRPARTRLSACFEYQDDELEDIRRSVLESGELDWEKPVQLFDTAGNLVASGIKTLYIASKEYRKAKESGR